MTETLTVLRGRLLLELGAAAHEIPAGRTTAFASSLPHAYEGAGRGACELVMTVHLPLEHRLG